MTIATPAEVAISIDENDPKPTTETYTFKGVVDCNKKVVAELPLTLNTAWSSYWTEDYRVYPPAPPPTLCAKMKYYISLPVTAIIYLICHVREIAWTIVFCIPYVLFMPIMAAVKSCRFNRAAPVVTRDDFYYWLKRNGFSKDEMKKVKEAASTITMYKLAQKVTDVRAVEEIFKLQSIEKQKLVMVVIQQSREAIINANQLLFEIYRTRYTNLIFNWGAQDAYQLGDTIAKNGRLCTRGEASRKKGDWEQRVAFRVNLRINAVLRCINTIVSEGKYTEGDPRMTDLVRTLNRYCDHHGLDSLDWNAFVVVHEDHDNKLLGEIHTAATYVKQYVTNAIITESYRKRVGRVCWAWSVLLVLVIFKLAKVALKLMTLDFSEIGDLVDLVVGAVTHLAEAPMDALDVLENGLPTGSGISVPSSGGSGVDNNDTAGAIMNIRTTRLNKRLENKTAQHQQSMKLDKLTELAVEDQNPAVEPLKAG